MRMKLQSDPTIVYGIVAGRGTLGRAITRADLDKPSAYNTYVIEGLPPGPIANPGRAALDAVARPSRTKDVYFVADGTGGHAFAETLDQHNRNVLRWRQLERDAKERQQHTQPAVDRLQPDALAPPPPVAPPVAPAASTPRPVPRAGQRGEIETPATSVFGALPSSFGAAQPDIDEAARPQVLAFAPPHPALASPARAPEARAVAKPLDKPAGETRTAAAKPSARSVFEPGAQIDERVVTELTSQRAPGNLLDGPDEPLDAGPVDTTAVPVSAARRADQKARAARYGVFAGDDDLPADVTGEEPRAPAGPAGAPKIVKIYDASEGTAFDPLKDKNWDLNSAKTVPTLKPETATPAKPAPRGKK